MPNFPALSGADKFNFALTMVGYLQHCGGSASIQEISEHFRVRPDQVREVVFALNVLELQLSTGIEMPFLIDIDEEDPDHISLFQNLVQTDVPRLTSRQASAIAAGLDYLAKLPGFETDDELVKLRELLASGEVIETSRLVDVSPGSIEANADTLRQAILNRREISCEYQNNRGEMTRRTLQPLRLDIRPEGHYLRAWCNQNQDLRNFKLEKMRLIELLATEAKYTISDFPKLGEQIYQASKKDFSVEVELAPEAYVLAAHLKQLPKPDDNGTIRITIQLGHLDNLGPLIAKFGGAARVISPEVAKSKVREFAERALGRESANQEGVE